MNGSELDDIEQRIAKGIVTPQDATAMLVEIRRLWHSEKDPNYLYSGSRINRLAIVTRDAEIDRLREQVKEKAGGT